MLDDYYTVQPMLILDGHAELLTLTVLCAFLQPLMVNTLPYPFNEEIKGVASVSGVPLGTLCC